MILQNSVLEAQMRNESLDNFTSTISHEFRTPLSTCLMFLVTLLSLISDNSQREILRLVERQLNFLLSLVNDVIDLKMLRAGILPEKSE